jgi:hydroxymethylpyrimidine pyrophosphatase-like HAD family hydrolase
MNTSFKLLLVLIGLTLIMSACKFAKDDDHLDIGSFRIIANGEVVAQQNGTEVTSTIAFGRETVSPLMRLEFRDPEGNIITITDDDLYLEINTNNPGVVLAQNSAETKWAFTLTGVGAGSAAIIIKLMHGNHADFESRPIPVTIN